MLTPEQQERMLVHGRLRKAESGETIVEPSTPGIKFFVVVSGRLELHRVSDNKDELIAGRKCLRTGTEVWRTDVDCQERYRFRL